MQTFNVRKVTATTSEPHSNHETLDGAYEVAVRETLRAFYEDQADKKNQGDDSLADFREKCYQYEAGTWGAVHTLWHGASRSEDSEGGGPACYLVDAPCESATRREIDSKVMMYLGTLRDWVDPEAQDETITGRGYYNYVRCH